MTQPEQSPLGPNDELSVRRELEDHRERLMALRASATQICESVLQINSIPFHSVKSRVKSFPSILEKIIRKKYEPHLFSCTDVVGIRVMCLYPSHVDTIVILLGQEFHVLETVDKRPQSDPERFGYNSVHLLCRFGGTERAKLPEYASFAGVTFEIQVRTILQEAWAEIQHRLVYKSSVAAPNDVKRIIALLSAHLESADMHFQDIYQKREAYVEKLKKAGTPNLEDEPLNIDSLLEILRRHYSWADGWEAVLGDHLVPRLTELLSELGSAGITTVRQLVQLIQKWSAETIAASREVYQKSLTAQDPKSPIAHYYDWQQKTNQFFTPLGHIRSALEREFPGFYEARKKDQEKEGGSRG